MSAPLQDLTEKVSKKAVPLKGARETRLYLGGIGKSKLYDLINQEKLKPVRIGRKVLFRTTDLDAFIASL